MGVSTTISLALFSLILIISLGVFVSLVAVSLRINDPSRINLITDHVREELEVVKVNSTNRYIQVTNKWSSPSFIEHAIVLYEGKPIYIANLSNPIEIPPLSTVNLTCSDLEITAYCSNLFVRDSNGRISVIMLVTKEGNAFFGIDFVE